MRISSDAGSGSVIALFSSIDFAGDTTRIRESLGIHLLPFGRHHSGGNQLRLAGKDCQRCCRRNLGLIATTLPHTSIPAMNSAGRGEQEKGESLIISGLEIGGR
jgi:hypothetical protein